MLVHNRHFFGLLRVKHSLQIIMPFCKMWKNFHVFRDWGIRENYMRQEYETNHNYSGGIRDLQEWPCCLDQFLCCSSSLLPCPQRFQYIHTQIYMYIHIHIYKHVVYVWIYTKSKPKNPAYCKYIQQSICIHSINLIL